MLHVLLFWSKYRDEMRYIYKYLCRASARSLDWWQDDVSVYLRMFYYIYRSYLLDPVRVLRRQNLRWLYSGMVDGWPQFVDVFELSFFLGLVPISRISRGKLYNRNCFPFYCIPTSDIRMTEATKHSVHFYDDLWCQPQNHPLGGFIQDFPLVHVANH